MAEVSTKILKQVEFYFSNSNLPGDKFLRGLVEKDDGWVLIETIASFKMMKKLTEDQAVVVEAIRGSKELLEVNEEGTKLRRKVPLPQNVNSDDSSIYAKGFPADYSMEQLNEYFSKHLEEKESILCTRLRRLKDRTFKGSVFMEFDSPATAVRMQGLVLTKPVVVEGEDDKVILEMKADYLKKKKEERAEKKGKGADSKKRPRDEEGTAEPEAEFKREVTLDVIVKVSSLPEGTMREDIKAMFEGAGCKVAFIEFNKGNEKGYARLDKESEIKATEVVKKMIEEKTQLKDQVPEVVALEGEEEQEYWTKMMDLQQAKKNGGGRGGRGGRGRGGRGRGRGRGGGRGSKKQKN